MASKRTIVVSLPTAGTPVRVSTAGYSGVITDFYVGVEGHFQNLGTSAGAGGNIFLGDDNTVTDDAGANPGFGLYGTGSALTVGKPSGSGRHIQLQDWWAVGTVNSLRLVIVLVKK